MIRRPFFALMSSSRRHFLRLAAASPLLGTLPNSAVASGPAPRRAHKPLKILVLGGTKFVGPHYIEQALARGHEITMFNRQRSNTELFPDVEKIKGNRFPETDEGLSNLKKEIDAGRRWDAVFDTSAYVPRIAKASADLLGPACDHYTFISTLSVFADRSVDVDESAPVGTVEDETVERVTGQSYGPLKALCEKAVEASMPGRFANIRPGLIVGPLDGTDRFTWWPHRIARGGEVLAPGIPDGPIQVVDVRDLCAWSLDVAEQKLTGYYNVVGPAARVTMQEFLHGCKIVLGSDCHFTWVDQQFLLDREVRAYSEIPLWIPRETRPFGTAQCQKAMAAGMHFRPLGQTITDTLQWANTREGYSRWRAGMDVDRERKILSEWHARDSVEAGSR